MSSGFSRTRNTSAKKPSPILLIILNDFLVGHEIRHNFKASGVFEKFKKGGYRDGSKLQFLSLGSFQIQPSFRDILEIMWPIPHAAWQWWGTCWTWYRKGIQHRTRPKHGIGSMTWLDSTSKKSVLDWYFQQTIYTNKIDYDLLYLLI